MKGIHIFAQVVLLIFIYYLIYYMYLGILHPIPALGDSWDYHIPISQTILHGTFITLQHPKLPQWFYPGSSEAINSLLLLLHIPLTLSNILAIVVLFFCLWKLALTFKLSFHYALLFALSFCSLTVIVRWMNAVSIDVWVAVFYCLTIILLEKPRPTWKYFLKLGFVTGMLIGSKYTTIPFLIVLLIVYVKQLLSVLNLVRFLTFFVPFSIFGLFWYIRNYFLTGDPFYPLSFLGFKGYPLFNETMLQGTIQHPVMMLNAFFSEYTLWSLLFVLIPVWLAWKYWKQEEQTIYGIGKLFTLGVINFIFFTQFPTTNHPEIMVSSFRYSYPVFIPLLLGIFLLFQKYNKEAWLGYVSIACSLMTLSLAYYPKLILISFPLFCLCVYFLQKKVKIYKKATRKIL